MADLIAHMEKYLGLITGGWSTLPTGGVRLPFQIVEFVGGPFSGARTLATLGLSNISLAVGDSGRFLHHEFVMLYRDDVGAKNLPAVLQQVALECVTKMRTVLRGDVIGPRGNLIDGFDFVSLYVARPAYRGVCGVQTWGSRGIGCVYLAVSDYGIRDRNHISARLGVL